MNTHAHVICCNDRIEAVSILSEDAAKIVIEKMARAAFEKNKHAFRDPVTDQPSYEEYRNMLYWHIHTVPIV